MHTVLNPNFFSVPQLAQTLLEGSLASFLTFCSAGVKDMMNTNTSLFRCYSNQNTTNQIADREMVVCCADVTFELWPLSYIRRTSYMVVVF